MGQTQSDEGARQITTVELSRELVGFAGTLP
jgi:hypothetical protein